VYFRYTFEVCNGNLIWRNSYNFAIFLMEIIHIEYAASCEGVVAERDLGVSSVPGTWYAGKRRSVGGPYELTSVSVVASAEIVTNLEAVDQSG
jgi:hypothetical protein